MPLNMTVLNITIISNQTTLYSIMEHILSYLAQIFYTNSSIALSPTPEDGWINSAQDRHMVGMIIAYTVIFDIAFLVILFGRAVKAKF